MTKRYNRPAVTTRRSSRQRAQSSRARATFKQRAKTLVALLFLGLEFVVAGGLICGLVVFYRYSQSLPDVSALINDVKPHVASTIYSEDNVLLGKLDVENHQPVALSDVSANLMRATIAIEDHRFYQHFGIDLQSIARSVVADLRGDSVTRQGASTLTQQLVRNVSRFGLSRAKRYSRKIREALLAVRVEQVYTKQEILALYLNNIYYGSGAWGVQAAALTYFGKSASALDLSESALIAGLPQRPSAYTPFEHRKYAINRRNEVLDAMLRYGYITPAQCSDAKDEALHFLSPKRHRDYNFKAPYFVWSVLNELTHQYGVDFVYSGIRVDTTLNWKMQAIAEQQLENGLKNRASEGCNQGCLVCLDNSTGAVRAMVGGRSFHANQFNHVTQGRRPPGSTFKLFDYAAAFDEGKCTIDDGFEDRPVEYPNGHGLIVHDFEPWSYRRLSCREAIAQSINTIAVQVAERVGIGHVIAYAHRMGITSDLGAFYPTAIGASAVKPLDLAVAYSVVANDGTRRPPMSIVRITEADGTAHEVDMAQPEMSLLRHETVNQLSQGLEAVVDHGTGTAARGDARTGIVEAAAGKTGTTSEFRDAWFAGYTPELTTVIWVGSEHRGRHGLMTYAKMGTATGGHVCAPIWHDFMIGAVPEQKKILEARRAEIAPPLFAAPQVPSAGPGAAPKASAAKPGNPVSANAPIHRAKSAMDGTTSDTGPTAIGPDGLPIGVVANSDPYLPEHSSAQIPDPGAHSVVPPAQLGTSGVSTPASGAATNVPNIKVSRGSESHLSSPIDADVDVTVCVDSHGRATMWCPSTISVRMPASRARRLKPCTIHKPPPGA